MASSSAMPSTPFIGVRISWLILARNSDLARSAASALNRIQRIAKARRIAISIGRKMIGAEPRDDGGGIIHVRGNGANRRDVQAAAFLRGRRRLIKNLRKPTSAPLNHLRLRGRFMPPSGSRGLSFVASIRDRMDIGLAAHRRRVAEGFGNWLDDGGDADAGVVFLLQQLIEGDDAGAPGTEMLGREIPARRLADIVVDVGVLTACGTPSPLMY